MSSETISLIEQPVVSTHRSQTERRNFSRSSSS